jgi:hypothetical protein
MKTKTTDTPRTDEEWDWANADGGERFEAVDAYFARTLERELNIVSKGRAGLLGEIQNLERENARLREAGHAMRHLQIAGKPCSFHAAIAMWDAASA